MNLLCAALAAMDRLDDAKVAGAPAHVLDQLQAAYNDADRRAQDEKQAWICMVERLPQSTWLVGSTYQNTGNHDERKT